MGVKLGQKWAVKDGNLLASNQVGSRFFNKEFDFSRASNGTYIDRDGLLKTAELYNLIPYSEDFSQWTTQSGITLEQTTETYDPNGQYNAYKVISTNPSSGFYRTGLSINFDVTRSIYLKGVNGGETCQFKDGSGFGGVVNLTLTNEWVRYEFTTLYSGGTFQGMFIDDISSDIYVYGAQLVLGTEPLAYQYTNGLQGLPRISFEDGIGHLLLEPQSTNLITYSEDFSNASWVKTRTGTATLPIITVNQGISPKSDATADRLQMSLNGGVDIGDNSFIQFVNTKTKSSNTIYLKSNNGLSQVLYLRASNSFNAVVVTNEWKRFELINAGSSDYFQIGIRGANFGGLTNSNNVDVLIWGAQREDSKTSYIPTQGSAVTRLADVCNNSGSAQDFNSEEGVLYAEIQKLVENNDLSSFDIISINDNSSNNMVAIGFDNEDDVYARIRVGGVNIFTENSTFIGTNQAKLALKYKSGDIAVWLNGVEIVTNASSFTFSPNTLSNLSFDYGTSGENFYGKVRNLQVFTEALSDAELISLTT